MNVPVPIALRLVVRGVPVLSIAIMAGARRQFAVLIPNEEALASVVMREIQGAGSWQAAVP